MSEQPDLSTVKVQRNVREYNAQSEMPTLIMQALPVNALALATLAGEINALNDSVTDYANKAIVNAARLGEKLKQASQYTHGFDVWLAENCPRLKRSQAYNYMRLASEMPELLTDSVHTTGHLLSPSQAIALLSAPDSVKETVLERVEAGGAMPVAEINRLKKEKQQSDADYLQVARENMALLKDKNGLEDALEGFKAEIEGIKTDKGFSNLVSGFVAEQLDVEKAKLQQDLETLVAQHASDYQNQIDNLQDRLSTATNNLVKAKNPEVLVTLNNQIVDLENELSRTTRRLETANAEVAYRGLATHAIESSASMAASLLAISGVLITESATTELLLRAAHDLSGLVALLQKAATVEQFDIEG